MTEPQQTQSDLSVWHVPGRTPLILYSEEVCERIVADAFDALRRSGGQDETGGILFGSADDDEVKVTAYRPLRKESGGPFALTGEDHARMQQLIQTTASEPELRKLVPVGCYRTRIESELALSQDDLELWTRHFPFRWQVTLMMRIEEGKPVRAGFFFRPPKGAARIEAPLKEFEIAAPPAPKAATIESMLPVHLPRDLFRIPPERGPGRAKWYALGALAALGAMGAGYHYGRQRPTVRERPVDAGLRLAERDGFLTAEWKRDAAPLQGLRDGKLIIIDGTRQTDMPLTDPLLATASWSIVRSTEDVRIKIVGRNASNEPVVVQVARFVGPLRKAEPEPEVAEPKEVSAQTERELAQLQASLERQLKANQRHEDARTRLQRALQARVKVPAASEPQRLPERTPEPPAPKPAPAPVAAQTAPPVPAAAPVQLPQPEPAQYSGPSSGRIIWTGHLPANSTLTIDGRRPSAGSVSASLPPVPARVTVHSAEFTSSGLTLFTANSGRANATEARSARNGWMATTFVFDVTRAQDARLAESPSPSSPQRIVIRSGDRPISAAVIDWQVAR